MLCCSRVFRQLRIAPEKHHFRGDTLCGDGLWLWSPASGLPATKQHHKSACPVYNMAKTAPHLVSSWFHGVARYWFDVFKNVEKAPAATEQLSSGKLSAERGLQSRRSDRGVKTDPGSKSQKGVSGGVSEGVCRGPGGPPKKSQKRVSGRLFESKITCF